MFFALFNGKQEIPDNWRVVHVWVVQSLVISTVFSRLDSNEIFLPDHSDNELFEVLLAATRELLGESPNVQRCSDFSEILPSIDEYIKYLIVGVLNVNSKVSVDDLKPNRSVIMSMIKEDKEFCSFIARME